MESTEGKFEYKYEDHWPQDSVEFGLDTIAGAMEVGKDLFLLGSFGGFGGMLAFAHADLDKAREHQRELNATMKHHYSIYRLSVSVEND